jgi:hypothetical protein
MEGLGDIRSSHKILENVNRKSTQYYLCNIMNEDSKEKTSIYSCIQCRKGFHVNCFTLYHSREALKVHRPLVPPHTAHIILSELSSSLVAFFSSSPSLSVAFLSFAMSKEKKYAQ